MACVRPITTNTAQGHFTVPCGKCLMCLADKKKDWSFRMYWEAKFSKTAKFITLTYDEENVPWGTDGYKKARTLKREDLIRFHKSVRKANDRWYKDQGLEMPDYKLKYYSVGEYGGETFRPHYHSIMFNLRPEIIERLSDIWGRGHIKIGTAEGASINYTAKYLIDDDARHQNEPIERPFSIMSKGIGEEYLRMNSHWHKEYNDEPQDWRMFVITEQKHKQRIPRYYREKLFTKEEIAYIGELNEKGNIERYLKRLEQLHQRNPGISELANARLYYDGLREKNDKIRTKSLKCNTL